MIGARGGNIESATSINLYMVLSTIFVIFLAIQWSFVYSQYQEFKQNMYQDRSEIANLMTYIHHQDFKFIIGSVGEQDFTCPNGKYKYNQSSSNIYDLRCP